MFGKAKESRNDLVEEDAPPGWLRATEHGDRTLMEGRARRVHSPTARLERLDEGEIEALERAIAIVDRVLQERPRPTGAAGGETEA